MCPVPEATTLRSAQHSCWGTEDVTPSHPCPGQLYHMDRTSHQEHRSLQGLMPNIWFTVRTRGDDGKGGAGATPADRYTTPETSAPQPLGPPTPQCPGKHKPPKAQSKPIQQHTLLRDRAEEVSDSTLGEERLTPLQFAETSRGQAASCYQVPADVLHVRTADSIRLLFALKPHKNIRHTAM